MTTSSAVAGAPRTGSSQGPDTRVRRNAADAAVRRTARYAELMRLPLACIDAATGTVLGKSEPRMLPLLPGELRRHLRGTAGVHVLEHPLGATFVWAPLPRSGGLQPVALGFVVSRPDAKEITLAAAEAGWSQEELREWASRQKPCSAEHLQVLMELAVRQIDREIREADLQLEVAQLTTQLEQTYEEISLLHNLARNLQISRSPSDLAEMCLSRLHVLTEAEGNIIWIEERRGLSRSFVQGELPFDEIGIARLIARFENSDWSKPLVRNRIEGTLLGSDFPGLRNIVLVPIAEGSYRYGWIASVNRPGHREFGTVEASLISSVATILGTHLRNIDLYEQHNELLLRFVKTLVSTLDAKDPYTRGHSERVALIARRLGEEMDLPEDELHDLYLAGLLHDIGKIGVDDRILQKPGSLTEEEFRKVQQHPMIGYMILQGLHNLQRVLPGVRNHHEAWNGKGYPDGLSGEEIPLMARILAVADSYDAMGSDRPYRPGMPPEQIEEIFRAGTGRQWDARIIDTYFAIRDDVRRICATYSPANGNLLSALLENEVPVPATG